MKKITFPAALAALGLWALAGQAQIITNQPVQLYLPINNVLNVALVGQVQQEPVLGASKPGVVFQQTQKTTNLTINTRSLLALIAADQGFTLPARAKLRLFGDAFLVVNQDNTIFTNVDRELLSMTYVTNVLESTTTQTTNSFASTSTKTTVAVLAYNGSSIAFTLNCYGKAIFDSHFSRTNAVVSHSFSCRAFGAGTCDGQNMIIKGTLSGKETLRNVGGGPRQPPGGPGGGGPGQGGPGEPGGPPLPPPVIFPPPPIAPPSFGGGGAVIISVGSGSTLIHPPSPPPIPIDGGELSSDEAAPLPPVAPEPFPQ